jgi:hypothetical protein
VVRAYVCRRVDGQTVTRLTHEVTVYVRLD